MLGLRSPGTKAESSKGTVAPPAPGSRRAGCVRSWRGAGPQCSPAGPGAPLVGGAGVGETLRLGECPGPPRKDADARLSPAVRVFLVSKLCCVPGAGLFRLSPVPVSGFMMESCVKGQERRQRKEVVSWLKADTKSHSKSTGATFVIVTFTYGVGGRLEGLLTHHSPNSNLVWGVGVHLNSSSASRSCGHGLA